MTLLQQHESILNLNNKSVMRNELKKMESFYITLTTTPGSDFYSNTLSNFKTKLPSQIKLDGDWCVGLSTISYTHSWFNIPNKEYIKFTYYDGGIKEFIRSAVLDKNNYEDIDKLILAINTSIKLVQDELQKKDNKIVLPEFKLDKKFNFVYSNLGNKNKFLIYPQISERLCKILGFKQSIVDRKISSTFQHYEDELKMNKNFFPTHDKKDMKLWGKNVYEIKGSYHSLFIFCDLIKDSFLSERNVPLLRYIPVPTNSKYGDQITSEYNKSQYIQLREKEFDSIKISIKDENDEYFPFLHGSVIIVLHFKKI